MEQNEKNAEVLNDLVKINNDRMAGYTKAMEEAKDEDADLKALFGKMKGESAGYKAELLALVAANGEEAAEGTRLDGKIYRAWMDVKATFTGSSRKTILESCEFGEDAAQKAYKSALAEEGLTADTRALIAKQQAALKSSHDTIKQMRDSAK